MQGFQVNQLEHGLQTATLAERGRRRPRHGRRLAVPRHRQDHLQRQPPGDRRRDDPAVGLADEAYWVVKVHQDFEGMHYYARMGLDPMMRRKHDDHPPTSWPSASPTSGTRTRSTPTTPRCRSSTSSRWCARSSAARRGAADPLQ